MMWINFTIARSCQAVTESMEFTVRYRSLHCNDPKWLRVGHDGILQLPSVCRRQKSVIWSIHDFLAVGEGYWGRLLILTISPYMSTSETKKKKNYFRLYILYSCGFLCCSIDVGQMVGLCETFQDLRSHSQRVI